MTVYREARIRLGVWLLKPLLRAEMVLAAHMCGEQQERALERYWMGRFTGAERILSRRAIEERRRG